jgi:hypothetical protein
LIAYLVGSVILPPVGLAGGALSQVAGWLLMVIGCICGLAKRR